ncbi:sodium/calcium exchanger 1-like isoform X2 [Babylonia areolata]|uniref:sodium/calcium exchanger 1-like isoform X2 n=1 Tax=Babylonia areolata TaxID=304850 RepID=UPI003FCEF82E
MAAFTSGTVLSGLHAPWGVALSHVGKFLVIPLLIFLDILPGTEAEEKKTSGEQNCTSDSEKCRNGLLIPMWTPQGNLSIGDKSARAIVYMVALIYMFLGVSIVADRFMAAIEVITSKEKDVVIKKPDGQTTTVSVRIWNETVSNLTLMALGSSAPEILLAIIEIGHNKFEAGDLGPSTIVGSAAFNLFIIIAICVVTIPRGEVRRINHLRVFIVTATWSVFAYIWLYFILSVTSEGVVEVWEALLTFAFFPATVITAYIVDRKLLFYKLLETRYTAYWKSSTAEPVADNEFLDGKANPLAEENKQEGSQSKKEDKQVTLEDPNFQEFEQHRSDFIGILRELRRRHPNADTRTLEEMAELEAINRWPKSRAYYRIQATRKLTGAGKVIKRNKIERRNSLQDVKVTEDEEKTSLVTQVYFDPGHYTVMENVGTFALTVSRQGGNMDTTLHVDYHTVDGTANAGSDYVAAEGTLVFQPGEKHRQLSIIVIDDDVFEDDEHFFVHLSNVRITERDGDKSDNADAPCAELAVPFVATVMILDDDYPGVFQFADRELSVTENVGELKIKVVRSSGARGSVAVPFHAVDGTAKAGIDYEIITGELYFENDETEQFVRINIVDDEEYEKMEVFSLELDEPYIIKGSGTSANKVLQETSEDRRIAELGKPRLGEVKKTVIHIKECEEFKSVVDKLLKKANVSLVIGTSTWREQFVDAITVSAGDEEDDDPEETIEKLPSCSDYVMHFLTLFWKVLFAFIPPTDYWDGWACFVVSILMIGLLTAIIGDLASGFGCTIGLKDAVTAISFVALGTSVPDTFASKVSAINDRYADSSIGNVTGSNAVNVFLGIGIAWSMAAIYHAVKGDKFYVDPGNLAMSVTVFCVMAVITIIILILRRRPSVGGELGGPYMQKVITSSVLVTFWTLYIIISAMVSYCYIEGF